MGAPARAGGALGCRGTPRWSLHQEAALREVLRDFARYCQHVLGRPLRAYQLAPARAILASVFGREGRTFTVLFARQMGKNELSAALEAYLLTLYSRVGGTLVKAAPTYRPQVLTSLLRLDGLLANPLTAGQWRAREGYIREVGAARALFFSGAPDAAQVVGATASVLLEIDEAQAFNAEKYAREFRPMGATANTTSVLYGTACPSRTRVGDMDSRKVHCDAPLREGRADSPVTPPFRAHTVARPLHDGGRRIAGVLCD